MTDEELLGYLRRSSVGYTHPLRLAADRIEELLKERDRYRAAFNTNCLVLRGTEERVERLEAERDALRARIDTMIDPDTVQKMLDSAQPIMAEACAGYEEANRELQTRLTAAEAQIATLTAQVERLTGAADRVANWTIGGKIADDPENREKYPLLTQAILDLRAAVEAARTGLATTEEGK